MTTDITAELQQGGTIYLDSDSIVTECIVLPTATFVYGHGHRLSLPAHPAQNLGGLDHSVSPPKGNVLSTGHNALKGLLLEDLILDYQIGSPADLFSGTFCLPTKQDSGVVYKDVTLENYNAGIHQYADGLHVESDNTVVKNVQSGSQMVPVDLTKQGGCPGVLLIAAGLDPLSGLIVKKVGGSAFVEIDGALADSSFVDGDVDHILIGTRVTDNWEGSLWSKVSASRPLYVGPALQFSVPTGTGWTIEKSTFASIGNPKNFLGTWGKGNSPVSLS